MQEHLQDPILSARVSQGAVLPLCAAETDAGRAEFNGGRRAAPRGQVAPAFGRNDDAGSQGIPLRTPWLEQRLQQGWRLWPGRP